MKKLLHLLIIVCPCLVAHAQQDPLYALYLNNPAVINPAFTGINKNLMANFSYRTQWAGFDGNPTTMAANAQISILDNKLGAGLLFVNDGIGENTTTNLNAAFSYKIDFNEKIFSFGMQAGVITYKNDPIKLNINPDPANLDDPAFARVSESQFNMGAGAVLKSEKFIVGLSVPRLLANSFETDGMNVQLYQQHLYLFGSYVYFLNERILLKPSILLKGVKGAPLSADVNFNLEFNRNFTAGVFTRNLKALGALVQFNLKEKYRLAYVYEIPTNKSVGTQFNTHEVMLGIRTAVFDFHDRSISNF